MTKGWNFEYLDEMSENYRDLIEAEDNQETKELYEEIYGTYQFLMVKLLFQEGKVYYSEVTTKSFLDEFNKVNNIHIYSKYYDGIMNKFALEVESLPRIIVPNYRRKISKDESFDIVGEFIKCYFGNEGYDIYKSSILDKPEYILIDHIDYVPSVTFVNDEAYLTLTDYNDIRFTSALAHEAGHIARSKISPYLEKTILGEFDSFSYEIRLLIFMINRGIYSRDALKELLGLMHFAEKVSITKRYNSIYKLNKIKNPAYFDEQIKKLNLIEKAGIPNMYELYNFIAATLYKDYTMYIYSLLAVFGELDNPDYLSTYYDVLSNLGSEEIRTVVRKNNISVNQGMNNYLKLRNELIRLI